MADMGRQAFDEMKQRRPIIDEPRQTQLVQCVADHIIRVAADEFPEARMPDDWEVVLFADPVANAFALPGGRIGVHAGLLEIAENPDQLAAVMGHEVAHLLAGHGNERLTQQLGINIVMLLIGLFTDVDNQLLLQALGLGAHFGITLPFSRAHESEADLMGLRLMAAAGFDPAESAELWRNMARASAGQPPEFLSTHPGHDTRIEDLEANLPEAMERFARARRPVCR